MTSIYLSVTYCQNDYSRSTFVTYLHSIYTQLKHISYKHRRVRVRVQVSVLAYIYIQSSQIFIFSTKIRKKSMKSSIFHYRHRLPLSHREPDSLPYFPTLLEVLTGAPVSNDHYHVLLPPRCGERRSFDGWCCTDSIATARISSPRISQYNQTKDAWCSLVQSGRCWALPRGFVHPSFQRCHTLVLKTRDNWCLILLNYRLCTALFNCSSQLLEQVFISRISDMYFVCIFKRDNLSGSLYIMA